MYNDAKVIAFIPARGGSKGVPKKNTRHLGGIPLIAHTIRCAKKSQYIDEIYVSTDCDEIADVAKEYGVDVPYMRPAELATDTSPTWEAKLHFIEWYQSQGHTFDVFVLLQPTSPLRLPEDIDGCIQQLIDHNLPNVISVCQPSHHPSFTLLTQGPEGVQLVTPNPDVTRRQDAPEVYGINGAVYAWKKDIMATHQRTILPHSGLYPMPKERSIDIDDDVDFRIAESLLP